jgi:ureidoacrylate peracid hydrolase
LTIAEIQVESIDDDCVTIELQIDSQTSALLVIDIQKDFCDPDFACGRSGRDVSPIQKMVAKRLLPFLQRTRAANVLTLYLAARYPMGKFAVDGLAELCLEGSPGAELYLIQLDANSTRERILFKSELDAFKSPELHSCLACARAEEILIAGVATDKCVFATVLGARSSGYRVIVLSDLVAAGAHRRREHDDTLAYLAAQPGIRVLSSAEIQFESDGRIHSGKGLPTAILS